MIEANFYIDSPINESSNLYKQDLFSLGQMGPVLSLSHIDSMKYTHSRFNHLKVRCILDVSFSLTISSLYNIKWNCNKGILNLNIFISDESPSYQKYFVWN